MSARTLSPSCRAFFGAFLALSVLAGCEEDCPDPTVCDVRDRSCQKTIMRAVSCLRGGEVELPQVTVMSEGELAAFLGRGGEPTAEQIRGFELWNRGLSLFGLAPADYTLETSRGDVASQIAAAYFPTTKEIVVVDRGESLATERAVSVFAHEVVHALQDADYDLLELDDKWATSFDASLALDGVIEGEAVLYQNLFDIQVAGFTPSDIDWERYFKEWRAETLKAGELDDAPITMADVRFPYAFGGGFVTQYYFAGERAAVDALIDAPPRSTREVMFGPEELNPYAESDFWERAFPLLGGSFEIVSATPLGAWITRMHAARTGVPLVERLEAPRDLTIDAFTVLSDRETGQLVASWRARMDEGVSPTIFPGMRARGLVSWTTGPNDAIFLASDQTLSAPQSIAWGPFPEEDGAGEEATAAVASVLAEPLWKRPHGVRPCDARVPSPLNYRREP